MPEKQRQPRNFDTTAQENAVVCQADEHLYHKAQQFLVRLTNKVQKL
jgi:hypothetical protein